MTIKLSYSIKPQFSAKFIQATTGLYSKEWQQAFDRFHRIEDEQAGETFSVEEAIVYCVTEMTTLQNTLILANSFMEIGSISRKAVSNSVAV